MELCGWKTRSVFDRYRIVNTVDLSKGLAKLAGLPAGNGSNVVQFEVKHNSSTN